MNSFLNTHLFFLYHAHIQSYIIYFFKNYQKGTS